MIKILLLVAIIFAIVVIIFDYKKKKSIKFTVIYSLMLIALFSIGFAGSMMRSLASVFLLHYVAVVFSYMALLWYILRGKLYPIAYISPLFVLMFYLILASLNSTNG